MSRNAAIAEALGWQLFYRHGATWYEATDGTWGELPSFDSDGNAMLVLICEAYKRQWYITRLSYYPINKSWKCLMENWTGAKTKHVEVKAVSITKAVANAVFYALTGKEWGEE